MHVVVGSSMLGYYHEHIHVRYGTNDSVSVCAASWG